MNIGTCAILALTGLGVLPTNTAISVRDELCPKPCVADGDDVEGGTYDTNATFFLQFTSEVSGDGSPYCATCHQCDGGILMSFNAAGTGQCLDYESATTSVTGLTSYPGRHGNLRTDCDGVPDFFRAWVRPCGDPAQTGYSMWLLLYCPCEP